MKRKTIVMDMFFNIIATAIPTIVLQLLILPSLAGKMSDQKYGFVVTILSMLNVVPATIGSMLNNIRVLNDTRYKEANIEGDFNVLLIVLSVFNVFIVVILAILFENKITFVEMSLTIIVSLLWLIKEYFIVAFRININYVSIAINNLLQVGGYIIGYILFLTIGYWQYIYILGYLVSLVYIFKKCRLWKERVVITPFFRETTLQGVLLIGAGLLNRVVIYADKMFIYPILGGEVVAVYYVATVFGKVISLVLTPISSVMLTYLAKLKNRNSNIFSMTLYVGLFVCLIGYFICVMISRPILSILYPRYVDSAMQYIWITTCTTMLYALIAIINPFILKFFDMKWQIVLNGGTACVYLGISLLFLDWWGLKGVCLGALITNLLKLFTMVVIYTKCRFGDKDD